MYGVKKVLFEIGVVFPKHNATKIMHFYIFNFVFYRTFIIIRYKLPG